LFRRCSEISEYFLEGDFVEDKYGIIFDVKGYEHPPGKVVAYPRYLPSKFGNRVRDGKRYEKIYDLKVRYDFLRNKLKEYLVYDEVFDDYISEVPLNNIIKHYVPSEFLKKLLKSDKLSSLERIALKLALILAEESGINMESIGISGSLMVGLYKDDSDIDIVIYGSAESRKAVNALKDLFQKGILRRHSVNEYRKLFEFRKAYKVMSLESFVKHEKRKIFQGFFEGKEFFIRFVKRPYELPRYGEFTYKNLGNVTAEVIVVDDSDSIFTPTKYKVKTLRILETNSLKEKISKDKIEEIVSFRGRFCQQVFTGELALVKGKLEKVYYKGTFSHYRIIIGGSINDYFISKSILR